MNSKSVQQLAATAVISSIISIGALLAYQGVSKQRRRLELEEEVHKHFAEQADETEIAEEKDYESNETIIREQLARNYAFFGEEGMSKIRGSRVAVIGCGGVGSWASVMLVRS